MSQLNKNITLDVDMRDTILSVKQRIQNKEGVTVSNQDLVYLGEELDDGHTVASYNITAGSTIYALVRQGDGMRINVRNEKNGSVIALKMKSWYTVENVKNMIESMVGIPIEKQRLYVGQGKLKNNQTLADLNILSGETLNVISGMLIRVIIHSTGKTYRFLVDASDTVNALQKILEEKEGIHIEQQYLMFEGRRLGNGQTLADYDIKDDDEIYLLLRQCGC
ncbi:hypothetical protein ACHQM5_023699 [Ranunculus cassubicifolius]